ncbi:MAG: nucleotide exchange factor GrpE [Desulfocapsa sp.]|nr:MAG: nucleotide exchange factor GrpE [Desulfocapsa sp.]
MGERVSEKKSEKEILEDIESIGEDLPEVDEAQSGEEELEPVDELEALQEELGEQKDQVMRIAAEFENYKKRMMREKSNALKYAGEPILREILPVVDNLERAVAQGETGDADTEQALASLLEGVQLTLKSLLASLEKFEVTSISSVGEPFDPVNQEALTMEASDSIPVNHVINEFEKGYLYKDRLLRAAKVIVSSGA